MEKLFNDFLLEKEYVCGLSKITLKGYRVTWRTFKRIVETPRLNVDFDNMFITVRGKENKQRILPMSIELRKRLFPWSQTNPFNLIFPSRTGRLLDYDNCLEDLKMMCHKLQVPCKAFHGFRRAFAKGYIKNGGDIFSLQSILGQTNVETTRLYCALNPEELKHIHWKHSILSNSR